MNEHFVCIKVDREERPDVDAIYMDAVQAMTGHGGWPLNAFATPEQVPFYAGTYFPPEARHGPARAGDSCWRRSSTRGRSGATEIEQQGERIVEHLGVRRAASSPIRASRRAGPARHRRRGDRRPRGPRQRRLRRRAEVPAGVGDRAAARARGRRRGHGARRALRAMARGGIYDQLGGGFARYAVDAAWVVPHFEKMLYDNALLARAYLHGWQVSGDDRCCARSCCETLDWALRELRGPEGGFASALDADSEGVEGKFYVWTPDELRAALGDDARRDRGRALGRHARRQLRGHATILVRAAPTTTRRSCREIRARLWRRATQRVRPGLDDKRLTSWNALMIAALAEAGAVLERDDYLDAARGVRRLPAARAAHDDGRLLRTWKDGRAHLGRLPGGPRVPARGAADALRGDVRARWFAAARALADTTIEHFADDERGGFFSTADDHEQLVARRKDLEDTPIPSGNSAMRARPAAARAPDRRRRVRAAGARHDRAAAPIAARHPLAFAHLLQAVDFLLADDVREVAIVGARPPPPVRGRARARSARMSCWPAARRRRRGDPAARRPRRSTAVPQRTCASASPARRR